MSNAGSGNCRTRYAWMRSVAVRLGAAVLLGLGVAGASADSVLSVSTADGEVHRVAGASKPRLMRMGFAEGGRAILVDEYALVDAADGGRTLFATRSFGTGGPELQRIVGYVAPARSTQKARLGGRSAPPPALVIQHQRVHPANDHFAPTPSATFPPQRVQSASGQRGFAVVSIGESGRVTNIELLPISGALDTERLRPAIAAGVRTTFPDERRHDHTVYFAFEVQQQQQLMQRGTIIVTLPQCCGPEPPCNPVCP